MVKRILICQHLPYYKVKDRERTVECNNKEFHNQLVAMVIIKLEKVLRQILMS